MARQRFVAEASRLLAGTRDPRSALQAIARSAVPGIADWCVVDLVQDDGSLRRVAGEHALRGGVVALSELRDYDSGPAPALDGVPFCTADAAQIPASFVAAAGWTPERLGLLRRLGLHAYICAPFVSGGRLLGAITFVAEGVRAFGADDVRMAEEVGRNVALALDSARLRGEMDSTLRARDELLSAIARDLCPSLMALAAAAERQAAAASALMEDGQQPDTARTCLESARQLRQLVADLAVAAGLAPAA